MGFQMTFQLWYCLTNSVIGLNEMIATCKKLQIFMESFTVQLPMTTLQSHSAQTCWNLSVWYCFGSLQIIKTRPACSCNALRIHLNSCTQMMSSYQQKWQLLMIDKPKDHLWADKSTVPSILLCNMRNSYHYTIHTCHFYTQLQQKPCQQYGHRPISWLVTQIHCCSPGQVTAALHWVASFWYSS